MFKEAVQHLIVLPFYLDMESFANRNLGMGQTGFALDYFLLETYDSTETRGKGFKMLTNTTFAFVVVNTGKRRKPILFFRRSFSSPHYRHHMEDR